MADLGTATTGIFSVMMYSVSQRTNEFGVRMALGAQRREVLRMAPVAAWILCGGAAAWALTWTLRGVAEGLEDFHWGSVAATGALLALVAFLACLVPARRATRVDPVTALRWE